MTTGRISETVDGLTGQRRGRLLAMIATGWFLVLGMRFVVPAILPTIQDVFEIGEATAGLAVTVLWLTYAAMQFPTGALIDRIGERWLLTAAAALSGVGSITYWFAPEFGLFLAATAVFGLGTGLYGPTRGTVLSRTFDARQGTAFGIVLGAGSVGAAVLPAAAAAVTGRYGWRVALAGVAPAFFLLAVGLAAIVPARSPSGRDGRTLRDDLRDALGALRRPRVALAVVGATLMLFAFQAVTAFLTTYFVDVRSISQTRAGLYLSVLFVGGAIGQTTTGALADRYGTPRVLTAVALVSVLPLVAIPLVTDQLALGVLSFAVGLRMSSGPLSNAYIVDCLPEAAEGTAWGALRTGFFAVGSLGSTVVGALAERGFFTESFYLLAAITLLAAVAYVRLPER